jgi:cytochrome c-type biogenesis protein CcmH
VVAVAGAAALALGTYGLLGNPTLPSQPLAGRPDAVAQTLDLDEAITTIEARLERDPDDLRGWSVIAPAYMELGRFADAERAYRRILGLAPPTADIETDLAEALMMQTGGVGAGEPVTLLESAAARDPAHVRSRFYLASEATRAGDYPQAITRWTELIGMATGEEPWLAAAQEGLAFAQNGGAPASMADGPGDADIRGMVAGLQARLDASGGTLEEWTRLVRSYTVLGDLAAAQRAFDAAKAAYPDAAMRAELDSLARDAGLT